MSIFNNTTNLEIINSNNINAGKLLLLQPKNQNFDPIIWIQQYKEVVEKELLKFGGIVFRNFNINSMNEFNKFAQIICPNLLDYIYRSTPRTKLGGKIYTATEYPKEKSIPMHNENSYSRSWPNKILFYSVIVASEGGETPIADSRNVYKKIDSAVRKKFEDKGVLYVRNYTSGIDLGWQEVFQTNQKEEVNKFCKEHDIGYEWNDNEPSLRTKQICQATLKHPLTTEDIWFNQAHLFHISSLENDELLSLINELGVQNVPRNTFYGNGEEIEIDVLNHIREVYIQEKIKFKWHKGDVMLLDNILMAHSREPYKGERKVAVAMG